MIVNESELQSWLTDKQVKQLPKHMKDIAVRYARLYVNTTEYPVGRGLAYFMLWYNRKHSPQFFSADMINYWYYY